MQQLLLHHQKYILALICDFDYNNNNIFKNLQGIIYDIIFDCLLLVLFKHLF
jgi:hypothetical protein